MSEWNGRVDRAKEAINGTQRETMRRILRIMPGMFDSSRQAFECIIEGSHLMLDRALEALMEPEEEKHEPEEPRVMHPRGGTWFCLKSNGTPRCVHVPEDEGPLVYERYMTREEAFKSKAHVKWVCPTDKRISVEGIISNLAGIENHIANIRTSTDKYCSLARLVKELTLVDPAPKEDL